MLTFILLLIFSLIILIMGLLEIPLPFIRYGEQKKSKNIYVYNAPVKTGSSINKNYENEKEHFRFIKKHISNYSLNFQDKNTKPVSSYINHLV